MVQKEKGVAKHPVFQAVSSIQQDAEHPREAQRSTPGGSVALSKEKGSVSEAQVRRSRGREASCLQAISSTRQDGEHPVSEVQVRRSRGAPPGNLNALKHGRYTREARARKPKPVPRSRFEDIDDHILYVRSFIRHVYDLGMQSTSLDQTLHMLTSISLASIALIRLIKLRDLPPPSPRSGNDPGTDFLQLLSVMGDEHV